MKEIVQFGINAVFQIPLIMKMITPPQFQVLRKIVQSHFTFSSNELTIAFQNSYQDAIYSIGKVIAQQDGIPRDIIFDVFSFSDLFDSKLQKEAISAIANCYDSFLNNERNKSRKEEDEAIKMCYLLFENVPSIFGIEEFDVDTLIQTTNYPNVTKSLVEKSKSFVSSCDQEQLPLKGLWLFDLLEHDDLLGRVVGVCFYERIRTDDRVNKTIVALQNEKILAGVKGLEAYIHMQLVRSSEDNKKSLELLLSEWKKYHDKSENKIFKLHETTIVQINSLLKDVEKVVLNQKEIFDDKRKMRTILHHIFNSNNIILSEVQKKVELFKDYFENISDDLYEIKKDVTKGFEDVSSKVEDVSSQVKDAKTDIIDKLAIIIENMEKPPKESPVANEGERKAHSYEETLLSLLKEDAVCCQPGRFFMGASESDPLAYRYEKPQHEVTLTNGFWIWKTPVTQRAFSDLMGYNPSEFKNNPSSPVEKVSWSEAAAFCNALSRKYNLDEVYVLRGEEQEVIAEIKREYEGSRYYEAKGWRLPTEAEWEYACRAGTTTPSYEAPERIAWSWENSEKRTHSVREKAPNAWGVYDMLGNVWEWCYDWWSDYSQRALTNPVTDQGGTQRVERGGCWYYRREYCRSSARYSYSPTTRYNNLGFRVVLTMPKP